MIEIVSERKIEKDENPGFPKNIRQIGDRETNRRIYIEDYVMTYIKQLQESMQEEQRVLILYGRQEMIDQIPAWFINGAIETQPQPFYDTTLIDEHDWHEINQKAAKYFPGLSVLGWTVIGQGDVEEYMDMIELTWHQFFRQDQQIFLYSGLLEQTEEVYCFQNGRLIRQAGYFIYYERNEKMQNYMLGVCEEEEEGCRGSETCSIETGNDRATRKFRTIVQEKKEEIHRKRTMSFLYAVSSVLALVIMVIGITMLNNYEKMEHMETTLQKLSGQVEDGFAKKAEARQAVAMEYKDDAPKEEKEKEKTVSSNTVVCASVSENRVGNRMEQSVQTERVVEEIQKEPAEPVREEAKTKPEKPEQTEQKVQETTSYSTYVIKRGDTLQKICIRFYGDDARVPELCQINQIKNKDKIRYGQKLLLP